MINEVRLIGNLGAEPKIAASAYGAVANLSLATSASYSGIDFHSSCSVAGLYVL